MTPDSNLAFLDKMVEADRDKVIFAIWNLESKDKVPDFQIKIGSASDGNIRIDNVNQKVEVVLARNDGLVDEHDGITKLVVPVIGNRGHLNGKGFSFRFENGYSLSVQFGNSSYCSNRSFTSTMIENMRVSDQWVCENAEIAWCTKDGFIHHVDWGNLVKGWVRPLEVIELAILIANLEEGEIPEGWVEWKSTSVLDS